MNYKKKILIAPLDWGLGHASRCIPIANALESEGFEVIFAASGRPLDLLKQEFPNNDFIKVEGYNIRYPKNGQMAWSMLSQSLKIWQGIRKEHALLQSIIDDYSISGVISDNRFGMYTKKVPSVFISHQLNIQTPFLSNFINKLNHKHIQKFDQCWVPDSENHCLSGQLSTTATAINSRYTGVLSRFKLLEKTEQLEVLAIVSGPEPQRTLFENELKKQLLKCGKKALIVLGKPEEKRKEKQNNIEVVSHLNAKELNQAIVNADVVICRSGYSSIMDLAVLNKKAIFVPTPGQTEQLYLAKYFYDKKMAFAMHQEEFDLDKALENETNFSGLEYKETQAKLKELFQIFK